MDAALDDLKVVHNDLSDHSGFTLCMMLRDEMYFLPAFLPHYRKLGVERFIVLDDGSSDGSRAFLEAQPDVMILASARKFGEKVEISSGPFAGLSQSMSTIWRGLILQRFCAGTWAVFLDADEFVTLPAGMRLQDVAGLAEAAGCRGVAGVMLDVYPGRLADLDLSGPFDPDGHWMFDGLAHLELHPDRQPQMIYSGVRARLMVKYGLRRIGIRRTLRNLIERPGFPRFNKLSKTILMRWEQGDAYRDSHETSVIPCPNLLLPIRHYKFTSDLYRRVRQAISEGQHYKGAAEYKALMELLAAMERKGGKFSCRFSRPADKFETFRQTGNARL